jgi:hypothetical protein
MNLLLILIVFICGSSASWSQQLPELPMKDGLIYFDLTGKLNNTKKCILESKVINASLCNRNITNGGGTVYAINERTETLNSRLKNTSYLKVGEKRDEFQFFGGVLPDKNFRQKKLKCNDTLDEYKININYQNALNYFDKSIINILLGGYKNKIISIEIQGEIKFIFPTKNEYCIKGRNFVLVFNFLDGEKQTQDLTKYYLSLKEKEKIKDNEAKIFYNLPILMEHFNLILMEKMNDEIRYLEME